MPFKAPKAPSGGVDLNTLKGRLLLIKVLDVVEDITTVFGVSDAISCDITVLDGDDKGTVHESTLLFPKILQAQLKDSVGDTILARLSQGVGKPGQSPPWILDGATEADTKVATKYEAFKLQQRAASVADVEDEEPF